MRENFWHQIYLFQTISSNFGFCGRKASPPPQWGEKILTPDLSISGNFKQLWFLWQKSPLPMRANFWHQIYPFRQFQATLVFVAEKTPNERKFFDTRSICFRQFQATLVYVAEKPPNERKFFDTRSIHFRQFHATLVFVAEKPPPPHPHEGKFFDTRSICFRQFQATLVFVAEKPPNERKFLTPDLSISGNFKQLWFLWQKSPPTSWGKIFWHQIYLFQAILSNFGFCGRKVLPPRWLPPHKDFHPIRKTICRER